MRKRGLFWTVIVIIVLVLGGFGWRSLHRAQAAKKYVNSTTPTLFVHGWGSSYRAERQMVNYAKDQGITSTVVRADVAKSGKVTWHGTIKKDAKNPIIEVNLLNSKSVTGRESDAAKAYSQSSDYVKDVVDAMQKRYHFKSMNLVGHSMGNMQIAYYILNNANNPAMPTLKHQVAIAGHFNGLTAEPGTKGITVNAKTGEPSKMMPEYKGLLGLRNNYPQTARVLNIYGDLQDGTHSDGQVPVNAAKAYKYLVAGRAKSYQEKQINGKMAQHSKLHENKQVDRLLVNFLWGE
ncbi:alpha/beta hydrolase [Limosilactobacillus caecicola]|uniref:alpha/beta hydrolase n=1 Tax=Limosilactobacillus caecicola TaxID=2941332 RepID=UPI00203FF9AD|nr:alpha/beta hydrolase [Limosilactobacillus caecicola]